MMPTLDVAFGCRLIDVGFADETSDTAGWSHLLEHCAVHALQDSLPPGWSVSGRTTEDLVLLETFGPRHHLEQALTALRNVMPTWNPDAIQSGITGIQDELSFVSRTSMAQADQTARARQHVTGRGASAFATPRVLEPAHFTEFAHQTLGRTSSVLVSADTVNQTTVRTNALIHRPAASPATSAFRPRILVVRHYRDRYLLDVEVSSTENVIALYLMVALVALTIEDLQMKTCRQVSPWPWTRRRLLISSNAANPWRILLKHHDIASENLAKEIVEDLERLTRGDPFALTRLNAVEYLRSGQWHDRDGHALRELVDTATIDWPALAGYLGAQLEEEDHT